MTTACLLSAQLLLTPRAGSAATPVAHSGQVGSALFPHTPANMACPGPQCPYTAPTQYEQGFASDVLARMNIERSMRERDYTYQGQLMTLPALPMDQLAQQTAQAAAEYDISHVTGGYDYGGPAPGGYASDGGNAAWGGATSANVDRGLMDSPGHAAAMLSAAPSIVGIGVAIDPGTAVVVVEVFYNRTFNGWLSGQNRYQAELAQNSVYAQSNGTVTSVNEPPQDGGGSIPSDGVFPAGPIAAEAPFATGVDWTSSGPVYPGTQQAAFHGISVDSMGVTSIAPAANGNGYWLTNLWGRVSPHGSAMWYQDMQHPYQFGVNGGRVVSTVATIDRKGYWLAAQDGGVFGFGDATFYGSMGGQPLNAPIVGMAATADSKGYWLVASDGGIFAFGDATFYGSMGGRPLNAAIVGIATDTATGGYWMVAADGGIFSFNAPFHGSMGGHPLNQPVASVAATPDSGGYWLVASDGGIFAFGDASFYGSMGGRPLNAPIVGIATDAATGGYWMVAADGGIFSFNAPFFGAD